MRRTWIVVSVTALLGVLVAGAVWFVDGHRLLAVDFGPIPRDSPALAQSDIGTLLSDDYTLVRHVRQIPATLRESFTNVAGLPFDMNDPGDPIQTDDFTIHAPSRQLIFAGVGQRSAIVVYIQGGFVSLPYAAVFSKAGAAAWIAIDGYPPADIAALRKIVHAGRFKVIRPGM